MGHHKYSVLKNAFTLAEVLITLGIIGVVAAMTLPSLVMHYQKQQTIAQLKKVYTVLSQAIEHSKADNGDVSTWGLESIPGQSFDGNNKEKVLDAFASTYILPYLKKIKEREYTNFRNLGYDGIYDVDGSLNAFHFTRASYMMVLNDGTILTLDMDSTSNVGTEDDPVFLMRGIMFLVDLNGKRRPNRLGRDVFVFFLNSTTGKFSFYRYGDNEKRDTVHERCTTVRGDYCGLLIMMDGWQIKDDYPW